MIESPKYIESDIIDQVKAAADLEDVITSEVVMQKKGSGLKGDCPKCGDKKKFDYSRKKGIFKCWNCELGGADAIKFIQEVKQTDFLGAVQWLAEKYGIDTTPKQISTVKPRKKAEHSFRNFQLRTSGLDDGDQKIMLRKDDQTEIEFDRYTSGTVSRKFDIIPHGDDMILHYVGLDRKQIRYKAKGKSHPTPYYRVRFQFPSQHKSAKSGKPMKYKSPYGSGNHLWLPNKLIRAYEAGGQVDTLVICEGEKKADKLSKHGWFSVGIAGIHNFDPSGEMVIQFESLIEQCKIKNMVFMLDADWDEIKAGAGEDVSIRHKTFSSAVIKFMDYFRAYANDGLHIESYFGYHLDKKQKGIDDLLVDHKGKEEEIYDDFYKALLDRQGKGEHFEIHKISTKTSYQILEFWKLHNKTAFFTKYGDKLKELKVFKFNGLIYRVTENGDFEMDQKLMPYEQFWREEEVKRYGKEKLEYSFDYVNITTFLKNRGFGLYESIQDEFKFIHIDRKVVKEVTPHYIQHYVKEFTKDLEKKPVLELIYRGGEQYLGERKLANMDYKRPHFWEPEKDCQYLFFKEFYWKITADNIEEHPLTDLPFHVWQDKIIDANPKLFNEPIAKVKEGKEGLEVDLNGPHEECDILNFMIRTSCFYWKKEQRLEKDESTGREYYVDRKNPEPVSKEDMKNMHVHVISKMLAAGYVLHEYMDLANMKAIICIDEKESEIGQAEGGTGKSIWSTMFEYMIPTHVIDGKQSNLTNDQFIYDGVDEKVHCIVFDDCRVNLDFEFFFSQITRGLTVNSKGEKKFKTGPKKMIFNTNNMINGSGASFERRQYTLVFSDWYNLHRNPKDDFGHLLFVEWDYEQWNYFYNFLACCIQAYLNYGLSVEVPKANVKNRKLRQMIGDDFLDWAELFFDPNGKHLNNEVEFKYAMNDFYDNYHRQRMYIPPRRFKQIVKKYCDYAELFYNPQRKGLEDDRIRSGGTEYFTVADTDFEVTNIQRIPTPNF